MPNRSVKMSDLMKMTARELGALSDSEVRKAYQNVRRTARSRAQTFERHGAAVPGLLASLTGSSKGVDVGELRHRVKNAAYQYRWGRAAVSYAAYEEQQEEFRNRMQESMPDLDLSTPEKMDAYGKFMGEMQARYGEMWHAVSNQARDIYREAVRLNVDPRAFMRNYDYWADHIAELERTDPIHTRSERKLQPSDYARKLGLEKIKGGKRR